MSKADELKGRYFRVLDHGYVGLKDIMGGDESIVEAARVSYGKGTKSVSDDETLIRYLANHRHTTPTEMVVLKFNVAMPIHAHRQHIRHRMSTTNEYSARYSEVPEVTYDEYEFNVQAKNNKQGRTDEVVETDYRERVGELQKADFALYQDMLKSGVAKEVARMHLPLNSYTYFYWKVDLHNLFHYLGLRCDAHAQREVRAFANCMAAIVKECCPMAFKAWYDYAFGASRFSRQDRLLLNYYIGLAANATALHMDFASYVIDQTTEYARRDLKMTPREISDFFVKMKPAAEQAFDLREYEEIIK